MPLARGAEVVGGALDSGADMDTMGVKGHYTVSQPVFIVFVWNHYM